MSFLYENWYRAPGPNVSQVLRYYIDNVRASAGFNGKVWWYIVYDLTRKENDHADGSGFKTQQDAIAAAEDSIKHLKAQRVP